MENKILNEKLDELESKLSKIKNDEDFIFGVEACLEDKEERIDKMLMFLNDNPGIDHEEILLEAVSIDDGEDSRNYDNPYYQTKRFIRNYKL
ncbi:MAG: hypothetical protein IJH31_08025 [Erysipelotrichaceae bacterium]|nr:hypothetical protein [Erysipelotrichaceae bacterium]